MSDNNKDKDFAPINVELSDRIPSSSQRSSAKTPPVQATTSNSLTIIALIVAILACAASGYLFMQMQSSQSNLQSAEARIKSLENRLSATGEEMGNSTVALQVKVGELTEKTEELWEQMDKLWASAWRRNQQEIKTLNASITSIQQDTTKLLKDIETRVSQNNSALGAVQSRVDGLNTKVTAQGNEILAVSVRQDESSEGEQKAARELRQMAEKLILLEKRNTNLLQQIQTLETKVNELTNRGV